MNLLFQVADSPSGRWSDAAQSRRGGYSGYGDSGEEVDREDRKSLPGWSSQVDVDVRDDWD